MSSEQVRLVVGITGASGSLYADALVQRCLRKHIRTYLVASPTARKVVQTETPDSLLAGVLESSQTDRFQRHEALCERAAALDLSPEHLEQLKVFRHDDFYAPIASGSLGATHMCVVPCSMGTLGRVAHGMSSSLLERCADVMLKENRRLVLVPRETPLNLIHLRNMTLLAEAGAHLVPAMPGFYFKPTSIADLVQFVTDRIAQSLELKTLCEDNSVMWNKTRL